MRRLLLLAAAAVVLIANGWGVWQASQNRAEPRGGTLSLTQPELALQPMALESSVTILRLNWSAGRNTDRSQGQPLASPAWLDTNKLAELGFDCSVPLNNPKARRHYNSMPARPVFLALTYEPTASEDRSPQAKPVSGLMVVDAARDPDSLRRRYPDPGKHVICRGLVRMRWRESDSEEGQKTQFLQGWIQGLSPSEVSVPMPQNRALTRLARPGFEGEHPPRTSPRYSARVHWGKNYEPWIDEVRAVD